MSKPATTETMDDYSRRFVEAWFGKQPDETLGDAMRRYIMQPGGAWRAFKRLLDEQRINHDPGDEDRR